MVVSDLRSLALLVIACVGVANAAFNCSVAQDCTRTALNPSNSAQYVQCVSGACACDGRDNCFSYNISAAASLDACVLDSTCYSYTSLGVCESRARNWVTALLLQMFVGGVGAANFYIGRSGLGAGQLILFLIILIFPFFLCCASCGVSAAFSCGEGDNIFAKLCCCSVVLSVILLVVIIILCSLAVSIWWTVDIIVFATNGRPDSNGCTLDQPF